MRSRNTWDMSYVLALSVNSLPCESPPVIRFVWKLVIGSLSGAVRAILQFFIGITSEALLGSINVLVC